MIHLNGRIRRSGGRWVLLMMLLCASFLNTAPAMAQSAKVLPSDLKMKTKKKSGWFPALKAAFNFSFAQSDGVVGVPDGTTLNFGLQLDGELVYSNGPHEWRNSLNIVHTQTKTPSLKPFIKAADQLSLASIYTYTLPSIKWLGFFGQAKLDTPLLSGYLVKDADTTVVLKRLDGTSAEKQIKKDTPFLLTPSFSPLQLKGSVGASASPLKKEAANFVAKVGFGVIQTLTQATGEVGFIVNDDDSTADKLELTQLQDFLQVIGEIELELNGKLFDKFLAYSLKVITSVPFVTTAKTTLSTLELINLDLSFKLSLKVSSWASIQYVLRVVRAPLIVTDLQVTNNIVLSISTNILGGGK